MILAALFVAATAAQDSTRLSVNEAVARALATQPSLAAARAQRDRAAADVGDAQSFRLPHLSLDASLNRFQEPMVVLPLHSLDLRNPPIFDQTLLQGGLSLNWRLWDFGSTASRVRAQRSLVAASDAGVSSAESQLVATVVNAYLAVLTARGVLAAQDQRLAALTAAAGRTRQLLEQGKAARVDVLRVEAEEQRAAADRIGAVGQVDVAEHTLARVTDLAYPRVHGAALSELRSADTAVVLDTALSARAALITAAADANPEVRQAADRRRAATASVAAARAAGLPELRVGAAYVDRGRWWGDFAAEWQAGVSLSYPLYSGGGHQASVRRAEADDRAAAEQVRLAAQRAEQDVDAALASLREAHARVAALLTAVQQSEEVARIERLSLDVGSGTETDYLNAEASLFTVRASLVQARNAETSARVELARLTGQLSPNWLTNLVEFSR